jgi:ABC-type branched-subunit amino acid transport system substrate-binding protein
MKKWYSISSILVVVVVMLVGVFAACGAKPAQPVSTGPITIKLGVCEPLSGPAASYGKLTQEVNPVFLEVFNREGFKIGNQTYHFEEVVADDQGTSEGGAAAAKKLVYEDGCKIIYGHWGANFKAIQNVTNPAKVIFFTMSQGDAMPGPGGFDPKTMPYVVLYPAAHEAVTAYLYGIVDADPNYKRIGIVDSELRKTLGWEALDKEMDANGVRYFHQFYSPNTVDYVPYITKCAEAGCDYLYTPDVAASWAVAKQRWELGYKDMKVCSTVPISSVDTWIKLAGYDAVQGYIAGWGAIWEVKDRPLDEKKIAMFKETMQLMTERTGKPYVYTGWTSYGPTQVFILSQAMQKAGTVDDNDAIMNAIRGGTFDLPTGSYTFCGAKTYGSPILLPTGILECQIQGDKEVYYSEHTLAPVP